MADLKLGFIKPVGADNVVVESKYVKGGYTVVATTTERDNLKGANGENIIEGSLCFCQADDKFYIYNGTNWVEKEFGTTAEASQNTAGLMSAADKEKLDGIDTGANKYEHPSTHAASMITGLAAVATSGSYNDLTDKLDYSIENGIGHRAIQQFDFNQNGLHNDYKHYTLAYIDCVYTKIIDPITSSNIIQAGSAIANLLKNGVEISTAEVEENMANNSYEELRSLFYGTERKLPTSISVLTNLEPNTESLLAMYTDYKKSNSTNWSKKSTAEEVDAFVYDSIDTVFGEYVDGNLEDSPNNANGTVSAALGVGNTVNSPFAGAAGYGNTVGEKGNPHESAAAHAFGYKLLATGIGTFVSGKNNTAKGESHFVGGGENNSINKGARSVIIGGEENEIDGTRCTIINGHNNIIDETASGSTVLGGSNNVIHGTNSTVSGQNNEVSGNNSTALGYNLKINEGSYDQTVLGRWNAPNTDDLFQVGWGSNENGRKNALSISSSGEVTVTNIKANTDIKAGGAVYTDGIKPYHTGEVKVEQNFMSGDVTTHSIKSGSSAILGGNSNQIESGGHYSVILGGKKTTISGQNSIACGDTIKVQGNNSAAIGQQLIIPEGKHERFVVGHYNNADSTAVFQIGQGSTSERKNIFEVFNDGEVHTNGNVLAGRSTDKADSPLTLVTKDYVDAKEYTPGLVVQKLESVNENMGQGYIPAGSLILNGTNNTILGNAGGSIIAGGNSNFVGPYVTNSFIAGQSNKIERTGTTGGNAIGVIGYGLRGTGYNQLVVGKNNVAKETALFQVGSGDSDSSRENALEIDRTWDGTAKDNTTNVKIKAYSIDISGSEKSNNKNLSVKINGNTINNGYLRVTEAPTAPVDVVRLVELQDTERRIQNNSYVFLWSQWVQYLNSNNSIFNWVNKQGTPTLTVTVQHQEKVPGGGADSEWYYGNTRTITIPLTIKVELLNPNPSQLLWAATTNTLNATFLQFAVSISGSGEATFTGHTGNIDPTTGKPKEYSELVRCQFSFNKNINFADSGVLASIVVHDLLTEAMNSGNYKLNNTQCTVTNKAATNGTLQYCPKDLATKSYYELVDAEIGSEYFSKFN